MKPLPDLPPLLLEESEKKWQAFKCAVEGVDGVRPQDPEILAALTRVLVFSDFVADCLIRDPALLPDLIESGDLQRRYAQQDYAAALKQMLVGVAREDTLSRNLRRYRRREMVRIAWRDLAGWSDLFETVADLSALADTCLEQSLSLLHKWQCDQYGIPKATDGSKQHLVILALGKLGAQELNFSSDIDLIFAYPQTGKTEGTESPLSNEDFFSRLCRQLIKVIGKPTADGFVFRADLRLRPFGENGPLVMSFDAMEHYYEEHGREWERYALIKARVAAGDKTAGELLLRRLHPFVYRRYLDFSAFESLREMKRMIALEIKRKGMQNNIKLGSGGIREIEFFGQIFQLIRGGVTPALQDRRIREILKTLALENYIAGDVCDELVEAYVFLRRIEHRLQEFSDQQTHQLPSEKLGKIRLAAAMGWDDSESFGLALAAHRRRVHTHFQMLLKTSGTEGREKKIEQQLHAVWQNLVSRQQAMDILSKAGFDQPAEVIGLLDYLRNNRETRELSRAGLQRLNKLMPRVLKETGLGGQPTATLHRIIDLIKTIERRTSYLALLLENPSALAHLVKLSDASPWLTSFLAQHPVLLDELLDHRTLYRPPRTGELKSDLGRRLQQIPAEDLEYQIEELCIFKYVNMLRVAAADVSGSLALMRVSDHLSEIAETLLNAVVELAWSHLVEKHGRPVCRLDDTSCSRGFAVIAYGKLGGLELGYGSDLDLVFLHSGTGERTRNGKHPMDSAQFFNRLGQRVIHTLTVPTRAGKVYEIDMRLRPSGSSGILVSHIDSFHDYQMKDAWIWEHQALIKARPICGEKILAERFNRIRREVLARWRSKAELQAAVVDMREKMRKELLKPKRDIFDLRQGAGGIVDIEFLVQYLVLLNAHRYPELLDWTDNVRLLQTLIETGVMDEYTAHVLKHAYLIYRAAAHQLSLQEKPAKVSGDKFERLSRRVSEIWQSIFEM
jgi:glutamate-ammonia-ligase adenylyltransferase